MKDNILENSDVVNIQNKILELAVYLDEFCKSNNIEYYLMGGTALGAIRHKGFIPWDDDFDVFMTFENYSKFIRIAEYKLDKSRFYLQKENTLEWPLFFSKLRMNGTTYIEEDTKNRNMHQGFYIDVMCLNRVSKNVVYRYFQYLSARLVIAQTLSSRGYITSSILKKTVMYLSKLCVRGFIKKGLVSFVRSLNNKKTEFVGHLFGRAKFKNTSFNEDCLGKQRYVDFSSIKLPVPEKVEQYLSLRYGSSFMEMPDEKTKSKYPSHVIFYDTEIDYKDFKI